MPTLTQNLFYGQGEGIFTLDVEGPWPDDIDGYLFNVGPDKRGPGEHWFAGQGLLCRLDCALDDAGKLGVVFRRIETPLDRVRQSLPSVFKTRGVLEVSPFGFTNFANTNVQAFGDRLFIGYDVGRPVEVDPETMEYLTIVGGNDEWLHTLPAALEPMTAVAAHPGPAYDEGALYFANYPMIPLDPERGIEVCRWDLEGRVVRWTLAGVSSFDSIHDIKVTRDHVIIMDLPFILDFPAGGARRGMQAFTRMWIVSKADLRSHPPGSSVPFREVEIPMVAGHLTVDYEDGGGEVVAYLSHNPLTDLGLSITDADTVHGSGERFAPGHVGMIPSMHQPVGVGRYVIEAASGKVLDHRMAVEPESIWGGTLWTQNLYNRDSQDRAQNLWISSSGFDPELVSEAWWQLYAERHENVYVAPRDLPRSALPGSLARVDLETMEFCDTYFYADGAFPHPPTFVPRRNAEHDADGYVITFVHRDGDKEVQIFDAARISEGPLARATARGFSPALLLHSWWMPQRQGPRPSSYCVDVEEDAWNTLAAFGADPGASIGIGRALYGGGA